MECITLKAAMVMPALLLQRPHRDSKSRDHVACLERRSLPLWRGGVPYMPYAYFSHQYGLSHMRIPVWETHTRMGQPYTRTAAVLQSLTFRAVSIGKELGLARGGRTRFKRPAVD